MPAHANGWVASFQGKASYCDEWYEPPIEHVGRSPTRLIL